MKIVARQTEVIFDKKDEEVLEKAYDILDNISKATKPEHRLITKCHRTVYSNEDINRAKYLIYSLTSGNPNIGNLDEEGEDN